MSSKRSTLGSSLVRRSSMSKWGNERKNEAASPQSSTLPNRARSEVGTQVGTARAFPARLAHLSRSTKRARLA
jgi:hypothetical protein